MAYSGTATLTLIGSRTANNSASLDFTTGISPYKKFFVTLSNMAPITNAVNLTMLQSINGGSTWLGAGNYLAGLNSNAYNSVSASNSNDTASFPLFAAQTNTSTSSGFLYLDKGGILQMNGRMAGNAFTAAISVGSGVANVNALRFVYSSGNISSGTVNIYAFLP